MQSHALDRRRPEILSAAAAAAGFAAGGLAMGFILARLASPFGQAGPLVLLGLVLLPLAVVLILADPRFGIGAVFVTFPMASVSIPTGFATLEIMNVAVVLVTLLVVLRRIGTGKTPLPWHPALAWAVALLFWTIVALPSALAHELAIKEIIPLAAAIGFTSIVVAVGRNMDDIRKLVGGFVGIAVVIASGAFAGGGRFEATFGGTRVAGRAASSFDHSNQLGCLSALAALCAVGLLMGAKTRRGRMLAGVSLPILVGAQLLSLSRGAWIGTAAGLVFLVVTIPRARKALIAASIPLVAAAVVVGSMSSQSVQVQVIGDRLSSLTVLSPFDDRSVIWEEATREIIADPITGHGPGSFPVASTRSVSDASTVFAYHAHNIVLTWTAENGVPALLFIIGFAIAVGLAVSRTRRRFLSMDRPTEQAAVYGVAAALVALLAQGLVDYTLRNSVIFFSLWTLIGLLLAADVVSKEEEEAESVAEHPYMVYQQGASRFST